MATPCLIFDLDGTLADTNRDLVPALNRTTALDGLPPIPMEAVGHVVGRGVLEMLERAYSYHGRELTKARRAELFEHYLVDYEAHIADNSVWFDGLFDALDALEADGWRFAVCTNKVERLARKLVEELGNGERFAALTGGDTFPVKKPDPAHLTETIKLAGCDGPAIMVGDSINDIEAARRAGMPSIGVTFGYTDVPMRELRPTVMIDHFRELPQAVEKVVGDAGIEPATPAV